jgi:hypothetical protein
MNRGNEQIRWFFIALFAFAISSGALRAQQAPPAEPKKPAWDTSAGFGLALTSGNSDTLLVNANILAQKKWGPHELSLGADGSYGENDGEKNVESVRGFVQYNRLFTERFYGYGRVEAMEWAENNDADYIFGLAGNAALDALAAETAVNLRFYHAMSSKAKLRTYASFLY